MPEETPEDELLAAVRAYARARVHESSLRHVAKEVGIAHSTLRDFVRDPDPRDPYGLGRRRLMSWAREHEVIPNRPWAARPTSEQDMAAAMERVQRRRIMPQASDAVRKHVRELISALAAAGLDEIRLEVIEDEMLHGSNLRLRDQDPADRSEVQWLLDVDNTYEFHRRQLESEGIDAPPIASEPTRAVREAARAAYGSRISPRIPPRAYQLVFEHCQTLERASVPEDIIDEARRLMSGETFNTLNKGMADTRDEAGWVKDVQAAWAFIRDSLVAQGYDL